jgi:integrase
MYLTDRTSNLLRRWLTERDCYDAYADTNAIWLNNHGNRHNSATLNDFLHRLIEQTTISVGNRSIVWHSLRKTTGTYSSSEGGRGVAKAILGHEFDDSTDIYDLPPAELTREALRHLYPANQRQ